MEIEGKFNKAKVMIDDIDAATYSQIQTFLNNENFQGKQIRIMPDTHKGIGSVIGFTMPVGDRVCPNLVGVDIGCGVLSCNIGKVLPSEFYTINNVIRDIIPLGFKKHTKVSKVNAICKYKKFDFALFDKTLEVLCKELNLNHYQVKCSLGTLGGGNHFIEIGIDENENYWITIHSGSRNLGLQVAKHWQNIAIDDELVMLNYARFKIRENTPKENIQEELSKLKTPEKELSHLDEVNTQKYLIDMSIAQEYATVNRYKMLDLILNAFNLDKGEIVESIHNFIDFEDNIIRKGAIRSYKNEKLIIPFNMRDGLLICKGKSNLDWNCSAPHGAGRILSRTKAKEILNMQEFEEQMVDVYSTSVKLSTLDEAPNSYKDNQMIEDAIEPTAEIIHRVKPVLNIKA